MATFNILFGFQQEETRGKIIQEILRCGHQVNYDVRTTKEGIGAYLNEHKEYQHCVLREGMEAEQFLAAEMAALTDNRDIDIVAIIDRKHYGTDFMDTLYSAGITSAIMVTEKKGANPRTIAHLLMEKRTRKKARQYYGMGERNVSLNVLTYQEFVQQYSTLMNENAGLNLIDRYLTVVRHLSPRQVADFTKRIPAEVRKELTRYEEFYLVVDTLKKNGISLKFTKPENLIRGLTDEQYTQALRKDGRIPLQQSGKQQEQPKGALQPPQQPTDTAKETVTESGTQEPSKSKEEEASFGTENFFFVPQTETVVEQDSHPPKVTEPVATATQNSLNQRKIPKKSKTVAQLKEELRILKKQQKQDKKRRTEENKRERKSIHWKVVLSTLFTGVFLLALWYFLMDNYGHLLFF